MVVTLDFDNILNAKFFMQAKAIFFSYLRLLMIKDEVTPCAVLVIQAFAIKPPSAPLFYLHFN